MSVSAKPPSLSSACRPATGQPSHTRTHTHTHTGTVQRGVATRTHTNHRPRRCAPPIARAHSSRRQHSPPPLHTPGPPCPPRARASQARPRDAAYGKGGRRENAERWSAFFLPQSDERKRGFSWCDALSAWDPTQKRLPTTHSAHTHTACTTHTTHAHRNNARQPFWTVRLLYTHQTFPPSRPPSPPGSPPSHHCINSPHHRTNKS